MAYQELRQHLRVKAESKAIIRLPDGARVRCTLHDMSLGGAYMIRSTEHGPPAAVAAGERVKVTMFDRENGSGYELEAEVIRVEALGGPGVALRWIHEQDQVAEFEHHIGRTAEKQAVPKSALGIPILSYPGSKLGSAERITKAVVPISIAGTVLGLVLVAGTWLRMLLNSG